jgi:hypothetical protein
MKKKTRNLLKLLIPWRGYHAKKSKKIPWRGYHAKKSKKIPWRGYHAEKSKKYHGQMGTHAFTPPLYCKWQITLKCTYNVRLSY